MTKNISRRKFIKKFLLGLTYMTLLDLFHIKRLHAKSKPKIVILGTGIGGASCLHYLNEISNLVDITVIDKNNKIRTGPFSNLVIGDLLSEKDITFSVNKNRYQNINFINKEVDYINSENKYVKISNDLKVIDAAAVSLARENNIPIIISSIFENGNLLKICKANKGIFTIVN